MQQMFSLLQILLLARHISDTIMPIIRSSRVLYKWLLPMVFGALVFKLSVWCGAEGCVSGLRAAARRRWYQRSILSASRSQWPRYLRRGSAVVRLLGLRVRIPPWSWISCGSCVLSGTSLCVEPIPLPKESCRVLCV